MGYLCDHCDVSLQVDPNGYFVDDSGSSDCPKDEGGHTWEGRAGL
ncbi:hypothetical protein SEA_NUCCI_60 [Microbacterium phage Nucci]|nr:hypothetical protein SEA_NUCCI_60 [Microbacterium phage Nucci]